jgi:hypothetical protein
LSKKAQASESAMNSGDTGSNNLVGPRVSIRANVEKRFMG